MDLIDRKAFQDKIWDIRTEIDSGLMLNIINHMPTIDAKPIRHGEWIKWGGMDIPENHGRHKCSECMEFAIKPKYGEEILTDWCPYCGAKMRGKNHDKYRS